MTWEDIGSTSTGQMPNDKRWIVLSLTLAKQYIESVCGDPPQGSKLEIMWHEHELGTYPSMGIWSDGDPPWDYISACERTLEIFDEAVSWSELHEHFDGVTSPEDEDGEDEG